uniref:Microfilarial sheath protein SHP4 n=1 Tax=Litomosoides sigmodontis TaxID=42156 RepID=Q25399_LITSI|nr:microfilarial sheath protein SHP4 precursor [Litomosoides sigmodontis]
MQLQLIGVIVIEIFSIVVLGQDETVEDTTAMPTTELAVETLAPTDGQSLTDDDDSMAGVTDGVDQQATAVSMGKSYLLCWKLYSCPLHMRRSCQCPPYPYICYGPYRKIVCGNGADSTAAGEAQEGATVAELTSSES